MDLDHNAGGRVRAEVREALNELLDADLANPSSAHAAGRRTRERVETAREQVAALVGAHPDEVVFTSGGTEANNLAVLGALPPDPQSAHLVCSPIEHASLLRAVERAVERGASASFVGVAADGSVAPDEVARAVTRRTVLVSIGWANGEIGTLQPIPAIAAAIRSAVAGIPDARHVLVHCDAVQAAAFCAIDLAATDVDLLTLSGHKLGGLTGVGALVVRRGVSLAPQVVGGPQERERRAGTENVAGIVAFGVAARLAREERAANARHVAAQAELLWSELVPRAQPVVRLGSAHGLPNTLALSFPGLRGDALVIALDLGGVAVSAGSACAAGAAEPSHVLRAIGVSEEVARGALRLSLGPSFGAHDARRAAGIIAETVAQARRATASRPKDRRSRAA